MLQRRKWLAAALSLLVAAAILSSFGEREPRADDRPAVAFPAFMRDAERERMESRATLELPAEPRPPSEDEAPQKRDPFLVALPVEPGKPVLVLEANALRHSRLGELFVGCLLQSDPKLFEEVTRESGIDPLKDVDRVGFVGDAFVISGFFDRARWDRLVRYGATMERYGDAGRLYREGGEPVLGVWRDQLVVIAEDDAQARRAIDQLEGRAPVPESGIPEDMAYGEAYGVIPGDAARRLLGTGNAELAARIAAAASRVELHVDAMQDVAAVVRVHGDDAAGLSDLARALGGALALARVEAGATNDERLAALLEQARVVPMNGSFAVELALPAEQLEQWFEGCGERGGAGAAGRPLKNRP